MNNIEIEYNKNTTSDEGVKEIKKAMIDNLEVKPGDLVKHLSSDHKMVVVNIVVSSETNYSSQYTKLYIEIEAEYFDKSSQTFRSPKFYPAALTKLDSTKQ